MAKTAKKKATADPNAVPETKSQRFQRLANQRVANALKKIALIGNLSGAGYESTPDQREKIKTALQNAVNTVVAKLDKQKPADTTFTL